VEQFKTIINQTGGGGNSANGYNGAVQFMDIITAKTAKDFALDLKNQK
jgi:hypothetical protein